MNYPHFMLIVYMKRIYLVLLLASVCLLSLAQVSPEAQMSSWVASLYKQQSSHATNRVKGADSRRSLCAFVKVKGEADGIFDSLNVTSLMHIGDIHIVNVPLSKLPEMVHTPEILRIEAQKSHRIDMDSTAFFINAVGVYTGANLPQAFTGKGVVLGIQDIGFDFTHPNFYNADGSDYRIRKVWDMLSADAADSDLPVGAEYVNEQDILNYAHSRDGILFSHGTHTLGTAAGSGADSPYRGMAPEADICVVSNAVSENVQFISEEDLEKYTTATDVLGFKYIFDYADAVGKPCVISFSEGSPQDLRGDDVLYYEMLSQITGPGHILVAAAGNDGTQYGYLLKPAGVESDGARLMADGRRTWFSVQSSQNFSLRFTAYQTDGSAVSATCSLQQVMEAEDKQWHDTLYTSTLPFYIALKNFTSCYDESKQVIEATVSTLKEVTNGEGSVETVQLGVKQHVTVEIIGSEAEVELFRGSGYLYFGHGLSGGVTGHTIHSPSSAPSVISVGANAYRRGYKDVNGNYIVVWPYIMGEGNGQRAAFSSIGPTLDWRNKPDVLAPGCNIISSQSSFVLEDDPSSVNQMSMLTERNGRTYPWGIDTGTSMSTPVVAGTVALWLQADPTLSPQDVLDVIAHTSRHIRDGADYPNCEEGYGEIDVYGGLLYILNLDGIEGVSSSMPKDVRVAMDGSVLALRFDKLSKDKRKVHIFNSNGMMVERFSIDGDSQETRISLQHLPKGIYLVQFDGHTQGSTLIRR